MFSEACFESPEYTPDHFPWDFSSKILYALLILSILVSFPDYPILVNLKTVIVAVVMEHKHNLTANLFNVNINEGRVIIPDHPAVNCRIK
jgi:hypothetical protein